MSLSPTRRRDDNGLWNADFDLLTRLPDLEAVELVATEAMLATGWFERLHDLLPGLTWGQAPRETTEGSDRQWRVYGAF